MYFDRKCKITFICHGATIFSEEGRFSDSENHPPLNENGVEEMRKLCDYLKKRQVKNDRIYTSAAARCIQSAKQVSKVYKKDFEIIDLKPRRCGAFSGFTFEQIETKFPNKLKKLIYNPETPTPDDAEAVSDFIVRVKSFLNDLIEKNIGNRVIIVTYPDVIKAAVCNALDIPHTSFQHIYIKTGSATQISYFENWTSLIYSDFTPL
jgi:alpha-ribazole phosphatase/probable phosphoglycerate mutase